MKLPDIFPICILTVFVVFFFVCVFFQGFVLVPSNPETPSKSLDSFSSANTIC